MHNKICLCPATILWIRRHLIKSARAEFSKRVIGISKVVRKSRGKPRRSAKQRAATKRLVRWNKSHSHKRRRR